MQGLNQIGRFNRITLFIPPLEVATEVEWDEAGLCSHPLCSVLLLCSQDGGNLLQGHTTQREHSSWSSL